MRGPQRSNAGPGWRTGPAAAPASPSTNQSLAAKTHVAAVQPGWLARPELLTILNDAAATQLVTVVAPAGYGKSTLLALWHADPDRTKNLVVFTVDRRDSDPAVLWSGIIGALAAALPAGAWSVPARTLRRCGGPDIDAVVLPALQATLAEMAVPRGVTLALDDWHLVTDPACHHQLAALAGMLPPDCQLLISSRHTPALPVARFRANGRLLELGPADLRLSAPQAAALTSTVSGLTLPADRQHALTAVTEGWPAAIYLAARALRGHHDTRAVPSPLATAQRCVEDYVAEEILDHLDPERARALARTAVLARFTMPLCAHVAGDNPVTDVRTPAALPLVPLDDTHDWFRHHHLVRQALLRRLQRDEPHLIEWLHRRAATWHTAHGLVQDAVGHTLAAGDTDAAVDLIGSAYLTFINNGRHATVSGWLDRLGDQTIARHAGTAIVAAWTAAHNGDRAAVAHWLHTAEQLRHTGPLPDRTASVLSAVATIRATFGFDGFKTMAEAARTAVEHETDPTSPWYGTAQTNLAYTYYLTGRTPTAIRILDQALASHATTPMTRILATSILSLGHGHLGHHDLAADLAATARRLADDAGPRQVAQVSLAYTAHAAVAAHRGDHHEARALLDQTLTTRRRTPGLSPWPTLNALTQLAKLHVAAGDRAAAGSCIEEGRSLVNELPDPDNPIVELLDDLSQQSAPPRPAPQIARRLGRTLSEQEHSLLHLLPAPLTLRQIAAQRNVTVNTVKTQTQAIYRKLGAASRAEAVTTARAHGLIPQRSRAAPR